jgi:serine/threonine protein kinase/uncharacterized protein YecT (DUF1311 family)
VAWRLPLHSLASLAELAAALQPMTSADTHPSPNLGRLEDDYEFVREVGRGGMATVYLARDRRDGRLVAVKAIHARYLEDPEAMARFAREAQLVADLVHPNIVRTHAVERVGERTVAIVMQYVAGGTLRDALHQGGPLPYDRVTQVLRDVAEGLRYAHNRGVVHRDVKPENVFLERDSGRACLSDFGIAFSLESDTRLTLTGASLGTPAYMSPEAIDGLPVDGRTDIYSLGLVGWELVAGHRPWEGDTLYSVIYKQKHEPLPRLIDLRPEIPHPLLYAIEGALQKHRDERWANAEEFIGQLADRVPAVARTRNMPTLRFRRDGMTEAAGSAEGARPSRRSSRDKAGSTAAARPDAGVPSTAVARREEARSPRRRRGRWSVPLVLTAAAIAAAVGIGRLERSTRTETRADSVSVFTRAGEPAGSPAGGTDSAAARAGGAPIERPDSAAARNRTGGQPSPSEPPAAPAPAAPPPARETTSPTAVPAAVPAPVPGSTVPPAASAPTRPRSHADSLARCRSPLFVDQRACLFASLADEDAELNRSYRRLIAELRRRDGGSEPESVRRLRAAQRDWLVRRDEACQRQNPGDDDGLWARARARCLGGQADRRAQELEAERQRLAGG